MAIDLAKLSQEDSKDAKKVIRWLAKNAKGADRTLARMFLAADAGIGVRLTFEETHMLAMSSPLNEWLWNAVANYQEERAGL